MSRESREGELLREKATLCDGEKAAAVKRRRRRQRRAKTARPEPHAASRLPDPSDGPRTPSETTLGPDLASRL